MTASRAGRGVQPRSIVLELSAVLLVIVYFRTNIATCGNMVIWDFWSLELGHGTLGFVVQFEVSWGA